MADKALNNTQIKAAIKNVLEKYKGHRFTSGSKEWLRWALNLIDPDVNLKTMREGDLLNLKHEAATFPLVTLRPVDGPYTERNDLQLIGTAMHPLPVSLSVPTNEDIKKLKSIFAKKLKEYQSAEDTWTGGSFKIALSATKTGELFQWVEGTYFDRATYTFSYLLGQHGGMLKNCKRCDKLFLAEMREEHHDRACAVAYAQGR